MKRLSPRSLVIVLFLFFPLLLSVSCSKGPAPSESELADRESILDRVVHLESEVYTEIPDVFRWCDRIEGLKKQRIDVGGAELYVEEEGKRTPLVLINGGPGGTHHYFHPWFSRAKKYARIIYYDQRGCGLSDWESGEAGYSVDQAVNDLDKIRTALGIDKWVVLGYSYGGFLAQYYTVNFPENVAGLILLGSSPAMWKDTGRSRQNDYLSEKEREKKREISRALAEFRKEHEMSNSEYINLIVYNNFLNGDWKRQHFYKPSRERLSQIALYEWVQDENFNGIMNASYQRINLEGAFEKNPIPTLILEGKYDLTWGEIKKDVLKKNHPSAGLVVFENAAHGIYDEEPGRFFEELKDFIRKLPEVSQADIDAYKDDLAQWDVMRKNTPEYLIRSLSWGQKGSEELAGKYSREWVESFDKTVLFLRMGFALYDIKEFGEALHVFEKMQMFAGEQDSQGYKFLAVIWQGHMLDLLGQREDALSRYRQVIAAGLEDSWQHSQYGIIIDFIPHAQERLKKPFVFIANQEKD
jgi:proline iminopeptidase